jgi:hypothetical protein
MPGDVCDMQETTKICKIKKFFSDDAYARFTRCVLSLRFPWIFLQILRGFFHFIIETMTHYADTSTSSWPDFPAVYGV